MLRHSVKGMAVELYHPSPEGRDEWKWSLGELKHGGGAAWQEL